MKGEEGKWFLSTTCSFLEIYNEQIIDLLEPTSTNLQVSKEGVGKGMYVNKLTKVEVTSVREVMKLISQVTSLRLGCRGHGIEADFCKFLTFTFVIARSPVHCYSSRN